MNIWQVVKFIPFRKLTRGNAWTDRKDNARNANRAGSLRL